jgi:diguanylate cyclase (GGDEF)-like protein
MLSKLMRDLKPPRVVVIPGLITERGDAHARAFWTVALIVYLAANFKAAAGSAEFAAAAGILVVQIFFAAAAFFAVSRRIAEGPRRLICTILLDQAIFNALLLHAGPLAAPFVLGPLVMIFGSGLRYGRVYGLLSWTVGAPLLMYVMYTSPFWSQHNEIRIGISLAVGLIPPYVFRLTDELALAIRTDSMTKLRNVVAFEESLADLCNQLPNSTFNAAVVILDLDGFKQVNDVQGHDEGDKVLVEAARCLAIELSPVGVPARVGGDEFGVIVSALENPAVLDAALERFLLRVADVGKKFGSPLGASIGIYYLDAGKSPTPKFAKKAADSLMYLSKALGRNQLQNSIGRSFTEEGKLMNGGARAAASEDAA